MADDPAPVGSTWYGWGHHFTVLEHARRDGDVARRCRYATARGTFTVRLPNLLRYCTRTEDK